MIYTTFLPNGNEISLKLNSTNIKGTDFIPPFFCLSQKDPVQESKIKYRINISAESGKLSFESVVYSYGNSIKIFQKQNDFYVFISENRYELKRRYLEIGISICYSMILLKEKIYVFHSASLILKDRGFLFVGASGTGKSTLANFALNNGVQVLNDELTGIKSEDYNSEFSILPGPEWGKEYFSSKFNEKQSQMQNEIIGLDGIFFLERTNFAKTKISDISTTTAAAEMLKSFFGARFNLQLTAENKIKTLDSILNIVRNVPVKKISINLNDNFLTKILNHLNL